MKNVTNLFSRAYAWACARAVSAHSRTRTYPTALCVLQELYAAIASAVSDEHLLPSSMDGISVIENSAQLQRFLRLYLSTSAGARSASSPPPYLVLLPGTHQFRCERITKSVTIQGVDRSACAIEGPPHVVWAMPADAQPAHEGRAWESGRRGSQTRRGSSSL